MVSNHVTLQGIRLITPKFYILFGISGRNVGSPRGRALPNNGLKLTAHRGCAAD